MLTLHPLNALINYPSGRPYYHNPLRHPDCNVDFTYPLRFTLEAPDIIRTDYILLDPDDRDNDIITNFWRLPRDRDNTTLTLIRCIDTKGNEVPPDDLYTPHTAQYVVSKDGTTTCVFPCCAFTASLNPFDPANHKKR